MDSGSCCGLANDFEDDERTDVFINVYDLIPENDYGE